MAKLLDIPYFSQLGEGAELHNNDCGPACCSMLVAALKDVIVTPNEWYKMDGWGAPSTDIGTFAYQLQAALELFEISCKLGSALSLEEIRFLLNNGHPIIPLVAYGVFSDANINQIKGHFNHWLVIAGFDQEHILTLDPYRTVGGLMAVPNDLFVKSFLGSYLITHLDLQLGADNINVRLNELNRLSNLINIRKAALRKLL